MSTTQTPCQKCEEQLENRPAVFFREDIASGFGMDSGRGTAPPTATASSGYQELCEICFDKIIPATEKPSWQKSSSQQNLRPNDIRPATDDYPGLDWEGKIIPSTGRERKSSR